ncbi:hypothetical protein CLOBOL_02251 [Enterocloster bolteae ATCC BAA-613]|uniref:Uncharacterized protein n=1 Tax=Enterocloster bolteae (strain ATCC BAA-613 / DSM 15670 / CCUG 46953 / JCM 12243 / WAL 16351) TaxID=411902 RepID=A8RNR0_ENTBW|nr:hypothetical protein CLOBOL_02251 [Enterocloster bolteae ATCC BAA-613]
MGQKYMEKAYDQGIWQKHMKETYERSTWQELLKNSSFFLTKM